MTIHAALQQLFPVRTDTKCGIKGTTMVEEKINYLGHVRACACTGACVLVRART